MTILDGILVFWVVLNGATFAVFGVDKARAVASPKHITKGAGGKSHRTDNANGQAKRHKSQPDGIAHLHNNARNKAARHGGPRQSPDRRAHQNGAARVQRIPESTLLMMAFFGGTVGAYAGRQVFRHKTRKQPFVTELHAIAALQIVGLGAAAYYFA